MFFRGSELVSFSRSLLAKSLLVCHCWCLTALFRQHDGASLSAFKTHQNPATNIIL